MKHKRKIDTRRETWKMFGGHNGSWDYPTAHRQLAQKETTKTQRQFWNDYVRKFMETGEEPEISWRRIRFLRSEQDWWDWNY